MMRSTWIACALALAAGTAQAQYPDYDSYVKPGDRDLRRVSHQPTPAPSDNCVQTVNCPPGYRVVCVPDTQPRGGLAKLRDRVTGQGCSTACPAKCDSCADKCAAKPAGHAHGCLDNLRRWFFYQPARSCCNQCAPGCGVPPLYTYFLHDCAQGPGCKGPGCDKGCGKDCGPSLWHRIWSSGHAMFANPCGHSCGQPRCDSPCRP